MSNEYKIRIGHVSGENMLPITFDSHETMITFVALLFDGCDAFKIVKCSDEIPAEQLVSAPVSEVKEAAARPKATIKKKKPIDPAQIEELYLAGMAPEDIAQELGCRNATVRKVTDALDEKMRGGDPDDGQDARIK